MSFLVTETCGVSGVSALQNEMAEAAGAAIIPGARQVDNACDHQPPGGDQMTMWFEKSAGLLQIGDWLSFFNTLCNFIDQLETLLPITCQQQVYTSMPSRNWSTWAFQPEWYQL